MLVGINAIEPTRPLFFCEKDSGQVKFVEQGFVEELLMWWNDG